MGQTKIIRILRYGTDWKWCLLADGKAGPESEVFGQKADAVRAAQEANVQGYTGDVKVQVDSNGRVTPVLDGDGEPYPVPIYLPIEVFA